MYIAQVGIMPNAQGLPYTDLKCLACKISYFQSKLYGEGLSSILFANESTFIFMFKPSGDNMKITLVQNFIDTKQTADAAAAAAATMQQ